MCGVINIMKDISWKKKCGKITFSENNHVFGAATIILYETINNKRYIIVESDEHNNPTDYSQYFYNELKKYFNTVKLDYVYLDLSKLYGIYSKNWIYKWEFFVDDKNNLVDEMFTPINELDTFDDDEYELLKTHVYEKMTI